MYNPIGELMRCVPEIIEIYDENRLEAEADSNQIIFCASIGYPTQTTNLINPSGESVGRKGSVYYIQDA